MDFSLEPRTKAVMTTVALGLGTVLALLGVGFLVWVQAGDHYADPTTQASLASKKKAGIAMLVIGLVLAAGSILVGFFAPVGFRWQSPISYL